MCTHKKITSTDLVVNGEILHLRQGPGLSYPIIKTLQEGQALTSIEQQGDWIHVQVDDLEGWVASWLVKSATSETIKTSTKAIISQVDHLNFRSEPALSAAVLTQLSSGTEATFLKQQDDWIQIGYGDFTGWVSATYVTSNEGVPTEEQEEGQEQQPKQNVQQPVATENDPNTFTITVEAVNIRKKADLTSKKLGVATKGQQFRVVSRNHNWVQIEFKDKKKGWLYSFYGTFTKQSVSVKENTSSSVTPTESVNNYLQRHEFTRKCFYFCKRCNPCKCWRNIYTFGNRR